MNKSVIAGFFVFSLLLTSCNRSLGPLFSRSDKLVVNDPQFDYLSSKAKFKFEHNDNKMSASANFRVKKDSLIWLSISPALGIELARVLINQDNIFVLDRINKRYFEYSFKELSSQYGFEFNYTMLQSVLLGNLLEPYQNQRIQKSENYFTYTASKNGYDFLNYVGTISMKLERLDVTGANTENTISVTYDDFKLIEGQVFPNDILAIINYADNALPTSIDISYNKMVIESSPINFPFGVPSKYERK